MNERKISQRIKDQDLDRLNELIQIFASEKYAVQVALLSWDSRLDEIKDCFLYKLLSDAKQKGVNLDNLFAQIKARIEHKEKEKYRVLGKNP